MATKGHGLMASYAAELPVRERWAVVAYVRALQSRPHAPPLDRAPRGRAQPSREGESVSIELQKFQGGGTHGQGRGAVGVIGTGIAIVGLFDATARRRCSPT